MLNSHTLGKALTERLSPNFAITTMPRDNARMSVAEIEIIGRYPPHDFLEWNTLPNDMIAIIIGGKVKLVYKDGSKEMEPADVVEIPEGTEYYWECITEKVRILAINSPPFDDSSRKL